MLVYQFLPYLLNNIINTHNFKTVLYITIRNRKLTWNRFRVKQATPHTIIQNTITSNMDTKCLDNL